MSEPQQESLSTPKSQQDKKVPVEEPILRRSKRTRKQVERFKFDKAHGYSTVKKFLKTFVTICSVLPVNSSKFDANLAYTLAIDPSSGVVTNTNVLEPEFLLKNPGIFKAGKKDADSPGIMEAFSGPYRDDFFKP